MHSARTPKVKWGQTTIQDNALHGARGDERNGALTPIDVVEEPTTGGAPICERQKQLQLQPSNSIPKKANQLKFPKTPNERLAEHQKLQMNSKEPNKYAG
jgi:hypothetical protein